MAAVAGPFLLYHYLPIFFDWRGFGKGSWGWIPFTLKRPRLRGSDWIVIGVIAIFMVMILWQNYLVTGKPFKAPNKYDKSWERLGFRKDYTIIDALFYLVSRIFYLMGWFAPAIVGAYLLLIFNLRHLRGVGGNHTSEVLTRLFRLSLLLSLISFITPGEGTSGGRVIYGKGFRSFALPLRMGWFISGANAACG
jgi:hypothetical protein